MGLISRQLEIIGDKGKTAVEALFDRGASASFIRKDIAEKMATVVKMPSPWTFTLGNGKQEIQAQYCLPLDIMVKDVKIFHQIMIVEHLDEEMIIGADLLQRWKIKLDPETEDILIGKKVTELKLM